MDILRKCKLVYIDLILYRFKNRKILYKNSAISLIRKREYNKKLGQLQKETGDKNLSNYTILLNKSIVHESKNRFKEVKWLFSNKINYDDRVLVFHERI